MEFAPPMKPDDEVVLESILRKLSVNLRVLADDAALAVRIFAGQRDGPRSTTGAHARLASLIDDDRFLIRWNGRECRLGQTVVFRLFRRLATSHDRYVAHEDLLEEVWGTTSRTTGTVRTAVWDLRRKLKTAGMKDLADAIDGDAGHYGLLLKGLGPSSGPDREPTET